MIFTNQFLRRSWSRLFALSLLASAWATQGMADSDYELTLASYNINGIRRVEGVRRVMTKDELDKVIATIEKVKPHVIGLQEVTPTQSAEIANRLGMHSFFSETHRDRLLIQGNAILSRFPMFNTKTVDMTKGSEWADDEHTKRPPGFRENRSLLMSRIVPDPMNNRKDFLFATTHFGIYRDNDENRKVPARTINSLLKVDRQRDIPFILTGDLNFTYDQLEQNGSPLSMLNQYWTFYPTASTKSKGREDKIDYILERGRGVWLMKNETQHVLIEAEPASDHRLLYGTWVYKS